MTQEAMKPFGGKTSIYAIAVLLIVAALLAGAYAWIARTSPSHPGGPFEQVTIATTKYVGSCPIFVAQQEGHFAREGLLVAIQPHSTGKAALYSALGGQADLASMLDIPFMFAAMNGQPVSIVATISTTEEGQGIVGRRDRGIATPASLKGKRIGVTLGTSGHFLLDAFLIRERLSANEVSVRDIKPEEISKAMANGDIDAASTWEPYVGTLRGQLGANGVTFSGAGVYDSVFIVSGTRDYVVSHPETIKKVLRALVRGAQVCQDAPDAAREIVAKAMQTDATKLKELWASYRFNITLDQSLVLALEDETRWAIKAKLTGRTDMPNYLNYLYLDALEAVKPAAVTVIH
jgi:NitT/TauT family transport system substrate-binding protein